MAPMTTAYDIDFVHSNLGFTVRHLMITRVHGVFTRWSGSFELDQADPTRSRVTVEIDASSVDTRNPQRDGHLASPDFFDVARFPQIRFGSTRIEREGERLAMTGDFTLRGVTQPVTFAVEVGGRSRDSQGRERVGYRATGSISRRAFGVSWNAVYEGGSVVVDDQVDLVLDLQLIPSAP